MKLGITADRKPSLDAMWRAYRAAISGIEDESDWARVARAILAAWTEPGTLVVVTHGANILPLTGVTPEEGGMVIVKPDPGSGAKLRTLGRGQFGVFPHR